MSKISRSTFLASLLLGLITITLYLLSKDPISMMRLSAWIHPASSMAGNADMMKTMEHDPSNGTPLPMGVVANAVKAASRGPAKAHLVVPIGSCGTCIKANIRQWEEDAHNAGFSCVLISYGDKSTFDEFRRTNHIKSLIVADPGQTFHQQLNVAWNGRPYIFDTKWRLLWLPRNIRGLENPFNQPEVKTLLSKLK